MAEIRKLHEIAEDIEAESKDKLNDVSQKWLNYMKNVVSGDDMYEGFRGATIVHFFLAHSIGWNTDRAQELKNELREAIGVEEPHSV